LRLSTRALHPVTSANCGRAQLLLIPCAGSPAVFVQNRKSGKLHVADYGHAYSSETWWNGFNNSLLEFCTSQLWLRVHDILYVVGTMSRCCSKLEMPLAVRFNYRLQNWALEKLSHDNKFWSSWKSGSSLELSLVSRECAFGTRTYHKLQPLLNSKSFEVPSSDTDLWLNFFVEGLLRVATVNNAKIHIVPHVSHSLTLCDVPLSIFCSDTIITFVLMLWFVAVSVAPSSRARCNWDSCCNQTSKDR